MTEDRTTKFFDLMFLLGGWCVFVRVQLSKCVYVAHTTGKKTENFSHTMSHLFTKHNRIQLCSSLIYLCVYGFLLCVFVLFFTKLERVYRERLFAVNFWSIWCNLFQFVAAVAISICCNYAKTFKLHQFSRRIKCVHTHSHIFTALHNLRAEWHIQ